MKLLSRNRSIRRSICKPAAAAALACACTGSWAVGLGQMNAVAAENGFTPVDHSAAPSVVTPVTASHIGATGQAQASARAVEWLASAGGGTPTDRYDSTAASWVTFTLWNTTTNSAANSADLDGLSLDFNFKLTGTGSHTASFEPGISSAITSVTASTQVLLGLSQSDFSKQGSLALGPTGPAASGNLGLGSTGEYQVTQSFTSHFNAITGTTGWLFGQLSVGDGGLQSSWALTLESVVVSSAPLATTSAALADSGAPTLALKMSDNTLVAISPVPEPQSWALMVMGLAVVGLKRRRRP